MNGERVTEIEKKKRNRLIDLAESIHRGNDCEADFEEMIELAHELGMNWDPIDGSWTPIQDEEDSDEQAL